MAVFKLDLLGSIMVSYGGTLGNFKHLWTMQYYIFLFISMDLKLAIIYRLIKYWLSIFFIPPNQLKYIFISLKIVVR